MFARRSREMKAHCDDLMRGVGYLLSHGTDFVDDWMDQYQRYGWMPPIFDANPFPKLRLWP